MKLNTRVFELYKGKYGSLPKLARAMEISTGQIYKVKQGKRSINGKFIIGTIKALPEYSLNDLFYVDSEGQPVKSSNKWPEFREYARQKYPELDEDLITMIEDLIERRGQVTGTTKQIEGGYFYNESEKASRRDR